MTEQERAETEVADLIEEGAAFMKVSGLEARGARPTGGGTDRSSAESTKVRFSHEHFDVVVVGGGQAGLSVGYHLARRGLRFVILDAQQRIGDTWRQRWDSLRLFTPARYDGLDGMPFPAPQHTFPTKDEMADYLEAYASHFGLPVRTGTRVQRVSRFGERYLVETDGSTIETDQVVVAMANYQKPRVPPFAQELDPGIRQLHSSAYRSPSQLRDGPVLIVGAGNSGSEIAMELASRHETWMSGRHTGHLPFRITSFWARHLFVPLVLRVLFHRVATIRTAVGRKVRPTVVSQGGPLIRVKPVDLERMGVRRVPRTAGVRDGLPVLEDGRILDVTNVVWCTGFHPSFRWIDLPIFDEEGHPLQEAGIVERAPGFYFVGLHFQYAISSTMIHGVGRDAERVASAIAERVA